MSSNRKIIVIGCPGSGKSVLSRRLANELNMPLYHLDMLWHKSDKTTISKEEFDQILNAIMLTESWIIDGNFQRTIEKRIFAADTIILLDFPTEVCLKNANDRIGKSRPDMPWIEDQLDEQFEQAIKQFRKTKLPIIYDLLARYTDNTKQVRIIKTKEELNSFHL